MIREASKIELPRNNMSTEDGLRLRPSWKPYIPTLILTSPYTATRPPSNLFSTAPSPASSLFPLTTHMLSSHSYPRLPSCPTITSSLPATWPLLTRQSPGALQRARPSPLSLMLQFRHQPAVMSPPPHWLTGHRLILPFPTVWPALPCLPCFPLSQLIFRSWLTHRPDDGDTTDLWRNGKLTPGYTALQPRRQPFSLSSLWELHILPVWKKIKNCDNYGRCDTNNTN
jgi:hypothetical protein